MAPVVKLHFFAANDLNGLPILEVDSEDEYFEGLEWSPDLGLGSLKVQFNRHWGYALLGQEPMLPETFVRLIVPEIHATKYLWGGFILEKELTVIDKGERGAEHFVFGGPGPKYILHRAALFPEKYTTGGWAQVDLANWVWRWGETAPAGQILNRILNEDAANPLGALGAFVTKSFTFSDDSNSDPWADDIAGANEFELPIGQSFLDNLYALEDASDSLITLFNLGQEGAPLFQMDAYQTYGRDLTGAIGAGKVHFSEGVNINNELRRFGSGKKRASHAIVNGKGSSWAVAARTSWDPGDYIAHMGVDYERSSSETILERAGLRWLRKQETNEKALELEIQPGWDDTIGLYMPGPESTDGHFWPGDLVTVTTGKDDPSPLDYGADEDQLLTGFKATLRKAAAGDTADHAALSWDIRVTLNKERESGGAKGTASQAAPPGGGGGGGGGGVKLCHPAIPGEDPVDEETTQIKFYDANDGGDAINWTGILANQAGGAEGSSFYYFKSTAPNEWQDTFAASPGVHYRITGYFGADASGETLKVGFFTTSPGSAGNSLFLAGPYTVLDQGVHAHWHAFSVDVVAPTGTVSMGLGRQGGGVDFDRVRIFTVDVEASEGTAGDPGDCPEDVALACDPGTGSAAARCDHVHAHGNLSPDGEHHHDATDIQDLGAGLGVWTSYTPSWTALTTNPTLGSSTITGRYKALDSKTYIVQISVSITTGGAWNAGSGSYRFSLPSVTAATGRIQVGSAHVLDSGTAHFSGTCKVSSGSTIIDEVVIGDATGNRLLGHNVPVTWATSDQINLSIMLEVQ